MYSKEQAKLLRQEFWENFSRRCESHPLLRHRHKKWILHRTKIKGVVLRFDADRENAMVMIEINHKNEDRRLDTFETIEKYKPIIEDGFSQGLTWDFLQKREDCNKEVCRIYTSLEHIDLLNKNQWPEIFNFFIENMTRLQDNFLQIRDLLKEELK